MHPFHHILRHNAISLCVSFFCRLKRRINEDPLDFFRAMLSGKCEECAARSLIGERRIKNDGTPRCQKILHSPARFIPHLLIPCLIFRIARMFRADVVGAKICVSIFLHEVLEDRRLSGPGNTNADDYFCHTENGITSGCKKTPTSRSSSPMCTLAPVRQESYSLDADILSIHPQCISQPNKNSQSKEVSARCRSPRLPNMWMRAKKTFWTILKNGGVRKSTPRSSQHGMRTIFRRSAFPCDSLSGKI